MLPCLSTIFFDVNYNVLSDTKVNHVERGGTFDNCQRFHLHNLFGTVLQPQSSSGYWSSQKVALIRQLLMLCGYIVMVRVLQCFSTNRVWSSLEKQMCCDGRQDFLKPVFLCMGMLVQSDVLVFIFFIISSKTVDSIPALLQQRQLQLRAPDVQRPGGRDFV